MKNTQESSKIWDKIGLCTSVLCLIHCMVPPLLMIFLPFNSFSFLEAEGVHSILSIIVVISIIVAIYPTCKKHEHLDIVIFASLGILLVVGATFMAHHFERLHIVLTMIGSIFLIIAHVKNIKVRHGKCNIKTSCH